MNIKREIKKLKIVGSKEQINAYNKLKKLNYIPKELISLLNEPKLDENVRRYTIDIIKEIGIPNNDAFNEMKKLYYWCEDKTIKISIIKALKKIKGHNAIRCLEEIKKIEKNERLKKFINETIREINPVEQLKLKIKKVLGKMEKQRLIQ